MSRLGFVLLAWGVPWALPCPLHAGPGTGSVELRILWPPEAPGEPPRVRLECGSAGVRSFGPPDVAGRVVALGLPPGPCLVTVEKAGLPSATFQTTLAPGESVRLDVRLRPESEGGARVLEVAREAGALGEAFGASALAGLPAGRTVTSLLETVAGAVITDRVDGGGLTVADPQRLGPRGTSWTQTVVEIAGEDVTDPVRGGTGLVEIDRRDLDGAVFWSAPLPAERGGPGVVMDGVPRRGGPSWHGGLDVAAMPSEGRAGSGPPPLSRLQSLEDAHFSLGGPLVPGRASLFASLGLTRSARFDRSDPRELPGDVSQGLAHLVLTPREGDEIRLLGIVDSVKRPSPARGFVGMDGLDETDHAFHLGAVLSHGSSGGGVSSLEGAYTRGSHGLGGPLPPAHGVVDRLQEGPLTELAQDAGMGSEDRWHGAFRLERPVAAHQVRFGLEIDRSSATTRPGGPSGLVGELVNGIPARVWDYGYAGPASVWRSREIAAYASDRLRLGGRVSLEGGLRFESLRASAAGAVRGVAWDTLAPRLMGRARLGRFVALFGWGRYRHRLPLSDLAVGDPAGPQGSVFLWEDRNADRQVQPSELGPLVARVGPGGGVASIDGGLRPPTTEEFVAGLEARAGSSWSLKLLGFHRRARDLLGSVNVGVPSSLYTLRYLRDPGADYQGTTTEQLLPVAERSPASFGLDRELLTNPAGHDIFFESVELEVEGRPAASLTLRMGATASRAEGSGGNRGFRVNENDAGLVGELFDTPNATILSRGRLFFDRAYTVKVAADYEGRGGLRLSVVARYQDGQPFSRVVVVPDLAQGADFVQAFSRGLSRFSFLLTLDARIEKGVRIGKGRLAVVLDAFNLLGAQREIEEDVVSGPLYRSVTALDPPRGFRGGLRLAF